VEWDQVGARPVEKAIKGKNHVPEVGSIPGRKVARCLSIAVCPNVDLPIFLRRNTKVNLDRLEERFEDGTEITIDLLKDSGLVNKNVKDGVKILGRGELTKKFHVHAHLISKAAEEKITAVGGEITIEPLHG
jgi:ribosomal protein L15